MKDGFSVSAGTLSPLSYMDNSWGSVTRSSGDVLPPYGFGSAAEVVRAGRVSAPNVPRLGLLQDCSLEINRPVLSDAQLYSCDSGGLRSSVSLRILQLTERPAPAEGTVELQCFLNTYKGYVACDNPELHITWTAEDNTPINGNRFHFEKLSDCFSKLIIKKKLTDHLRKWRCQVTQNDVVKASISHTTTITDGVEEVFAAVGESVSLSCSSTSSLGVSGSMRWAVGGRPLTHNNSREKDQSEAFHLNKDSSLLIGEVTALNAGDYQCSEAADEKKVLNKIRLHTLDVTSQCGADGHNLTLTCVLTCTNTCDKDFNLTWSGEGQTIWQSGLINHSNTLINTLILPVCSRSSAEIKCSVHREGVVMATKEWGSVSSLQTPAWLVLPLGLGMCVAAGGVYFKRKRKDAAHEQSSIGMTNVYEDVNNAELQQKEESNREAAAATESFYDILQAVN
ncbi:uncharacterized protein LOC118114205 isoform X2 [Hippoglossus stenolepis]|uniref:uncharacterized protein LOC118114205 isoform X2 n=1 Tax=Hippoglossus stenolepis TaxID=195615 RepID=UPI001FAEDA9E|nr:uncharacterized protein LOC118114205 isoform X2 [Hippoglossus stenolepis]